jgi:hypothetical protein
MKTDNMGYFQQDDVTAHAANQSMTTTSEVLSIEKSPNISALLESLSWLLIFLILAKYEGKIE